MLYYIIFSIFSKKSKKSNKNNYIGDDLLEFHRYLTHHKWYTTVKSVLYYVKHVFKTSSALETRYPTNCEMVLGPYVLVIERIPLSEFFAPPQNDQMRHLNECAA